MKERRIDIPCQNRYCNFFVLDTNVSNCEHCIVKCKKYNPYILDDRPHVVHNSPATLYSFYGYVIKPLNKISLYDRLKACWLVLIGKAYSNLWYTSDEINERLKKRKYRDIVACTNKECENYENVCVLNCKASRSVTNICPSYE
jgi:hypothetical protein